MICADEEIIKAARVEVTAELPRATPTNSRRLQTTTSEAGVAHQASDQDPVERPSSPIPKPCLWGRGTTVKLLTV